MQSAAARAVRSGMFLYNREKHFRRICKCKPDFFFLNRVTKTRLHSKIFEKANKTSNFENINVLPMVLSPCPLSSVNAYDRFWLIIGLERGNLQH